MDQPSGPRTPDRPALRDWLFLAAILAATLVRVVGLPAKGTGDVTAFGIWMHGAATAGPTQAYGDRTFEDIDSSVDYPPMAMYVFAAWGRAYEAATGEQPTLAEYRLAVKLMIAVAGAGVTLLLWHIARNRWGADAGRVAVLAYWANPAVILHSAFLGYVGAIYTVPAIAAIVAVDAGFVATGGALLAIAALTKPQGILVGAAIALALMRTRDVVARRAAMALAGAGVATAAIVLPFVGAGTFADMIAGVRGLVTGGTLSAQAANVWWLLGYGLDIARRVDDLGLSAFLMRGRMVPLDDVLEPGFAPFGVPASLLIAAGAWSCVVATVGWALWRARAHNDFVTAIALATLTVHAYFTLAVQVHENHLALALPLAAILAAADRSGRMLLVALSTIVAFNLFLFYGLGSSIGRFSLRAQVPVDLTALLAAANVAVFVWHVRLFARRCNAPG